MSYVFIPVNDIGGPDCPTRDNEISIVPDYDT